MSRTASDTLERIKALVRDGRVLASARGYDELAADGIFFSDVLDSLRDAELVEDYPSASKGPSILVLQRDPQSRPIHVVWGIPKGAPGPAVLVTAYRPDPARWSADFKERRK
ncbi:MAG TPA: DUF4258 domain-containing protein [Rhizomicrobium sp.]|nr:DUF4258 domain-containing protein [Rhizomicrobium sp.]